MAHLGRHPEVEGVWMRWMLMLTEVGKILRAGPKNDLRSRGLLRGYCASRMVQFVQHSAGTELILINKKSVRDLLTSHTVKTTNAFTNN